MGSGVTQTSVESQLYCSLAEQLEASCLSFLSLSSSIYKMGDNSISPRVMVLGKSSCNTKWSEVISCSYEGCMSCTISVSLPAQN